MLEFLKERAKNSLFYIPVVGGVVLLVGFILYSAFLKPTKDDHTKNNAEVINQYEWWKDSKVEVWPMGCAHFTSTKPVEVKK